MARAYTVNCCQCGRHESLIVGRGCVLPPIGWLEVFVNPATFPADYKPAALVVRVCPDCNKVDTPARLELGRPPIENTPREGG